MFHSHKLLTGANATRRPPIRPTPRRVPAGFFDNVKDQDTPSVHRRRRPFSPSWGSRLNMFLARPPQLFRRPQPNASGPIELQQRQGPSTSSRRSPPIVEVPALDDKKALYTARRQERASDKAKRITNPRLWVRVVLFLCCASPSTDDGH
ncbi:uncharacterized protein BJ212DRAFT_789412 [Suillus subaureus]|uniref:Uncharacterized protein n=1 Tax=Suillus subaureus TaxID=48587 RepID=A0A9P7DXU7_9AGAM|nr:uncharacterized protein BJ212DRAFT_789412 [Suillus subaureus]KAG1806077.1 hypothetical protein BJ212DRAFT_789412 [Suillus subaureus]